MRHWPRTMAGAVLVATVVGCSGGELACVGGERLVVTRASGEFGDHSQLVLTDPDLSRVRELTQGDRVASDPSFSPDGSKIAYLVGLGDHESAGPWGHTIWVMNSSGGDRTRITGNENWDEIATARYEGRWTPEALALQEGGRSDNDPEWSPTRNEIVFDHYEPGNLGDAQKTGRQVGLFLVTPGEEPRKLFIAEGAANVDGPTWSPDGDWVAFLHSVPDPVRGTDRASVWVVRRDGSRGRRLAEAENGERLVWNPDGRTIVASGTRNTTTVGIVNSLREIDVQTGEAKVLGAPLQSMRWSPDGKRLYGRAGEDTLYVTRLVGGSPDVETLTLEPEQQFYGDFDIATCN